MHVGALHVGEPVWHVVPEHVGSNQHVGEPIWHVCAHVAPLPHVGGSALQVRDMHVGAPMTHVKFPHPIVGAHVLAHM
jgi:hypothetical protein